MIQELKDFITKKKFNWMRITSLVVFLFSIVFLVTSSNAKSYDTESSYVPDNMGTGIPSDTTMTEDEKPTKPKKTKTVNKNTPNSNATIPQASSSSTNENTTAATTAAIDTSAASNSSSSGAFSIPENVLQRVEQQYGNDARQRLLAWQKLIDENQAHTELEKLGLVNLFFNKTVPYKSNEDVWGQRDYWATPVEFLSRNAGDCEDYAIAKYYTLSKMGIPIEKLRLAYVKAVKLKQAHMVLTYYETSAQEPLILDNLQNTILYASERPDLVPVYTFNGEGLWFTATLVKEGAQKVGTSNRMRMWLNLQNRMKRDGLN